MSHHDTIQGIVRRLVLEAFEDFSTNQTFVPPILPNLNKAIQISQGASFQKDNEGSGKRKSSELSERKPQTLAQIRRLKNFFDNNSEYVKRSKTAGKTMQTDPMVLKWELHGGDQAYKWVNDSLGSRRDNELRSKSTVRKAGGAGENKGLGSLSSNLMDPSNTRAHSAWSKVKNR